MRYFDEIVGNDDVKNRIGSAIADRRLPHALIIEGEDGTGKNTMADMIAAALLCTDAGKGGALPCGKCRACRRVLERQDPDVMYLRRGDNATIGVERVRALRQDMYLSATEADRKIYIIDDAHTMTPQAQNALLKVLEEPPTTVTVMLLCERREALLSTVRSRSQTVRMLPLSHDELETLADRRPSLSAVRRTQGDRWRELLLACAGSAGKLIDLAEGTDTDGISRRRENVRAVLLSAAQKNGYAHLSRQLQNMGTKRPEVLEQLSLLHRALRDLCLSARDPEAPLLFWIDREEAASVAEKLGEKRLFRMCACTEDAIDALQKNGNMTLMTAALAAGFVR